MAYFDVDTLPIRKEEIGDLLYIEYDPGDIYPLVIERIRQVLAGKTVASELIATEERGGMARHDRLIASAKALPEEAWDWALIPRKDFYPTIPYAMVDKDEKLALFTGKMSEAATAVRLRGDALEVTLGWIQHALRLAWGSWTCKILRNEDFKL